MSERTPSESLRATLAALPPVAYADAAENPGVLRDQVFAVVAEMKARGRPPEQVLLAVKTIATEVGVSNGGMRLLDAIVRWCLAEYFRLAEQSLAPESESSAPYGG